MKPQGIEIRCLAAVPRGPRRSTSERERCLGLGAECTKASAASSGRRKMSLDIPFYRTSVGGLSWPDRTPNVEGAGPQLPGDQQGSHARHEPGKSAVPKLEYSLRWCLGLRTASSQGMVEQDH